MHVVQPNPSRALPGACRRLHGCTTGSFARTPSKTATGACLVLLMASCYSRRGLVPPAASRRGPRGLLRCLAAGRCRRSSELFALHCGAGVRRAASGEHRGTERPGGPHGRPATERWPDSRRDVSRAAVAVWIRWTASLRLAISGPEAFAHARYRVREAQGLYGNPADWSRSAASATRRDCGEPRVPAAEGRPSGACILSVHCSASTLSR